VGVFGELSGALGGSGAVNLEAGASLVSMDPSGTPPSESVQSGLGSSTGATTEAQLSGALGMAPSPVAQSNDGAIGVELDGGGPNPGTTQALEDVLSIEIESELESEIISNY